MTNQPTRTQCRTMPAWTKWKLKGAQHAGKPMAEIYAEAETFASEPGWPAAAYSARYRAFIEGAICEEIEAV